MAPPVLLDASCVLAWLFGEPGAELIEPVLSTSYITAVNMAEVITKVERLTGQGQGCADDLVEAGMTVIPVGWQEISAVANVRQQEFSQPKSAALSLGDAICISVAVTHQMELWTADRNWENLDLPIAISLIR